MNRVQQPWICIAHTNLVMDTVKKLVIFSKFRSRNPYGNTGLFPQANKKLLRIGANRNIKNKLSCHSDLS